MANPGSYSAAGMARLANDTLLDESRLIAALLDQLDVVMQSVLEMSEKANSAATILSASSRVLTDSNDTEGLRLAAECVSMDQAIHTVRRTVDIVKQLGDSIGSQNQDIRTKIDEYIDRLIA